MTKKKNLEWRDCSEDQLQSLVHEWVRQLQSDQAIDQGAVMLLDGPMGAGKSTFSRFCPFV